MIELCANCMPLLLCRALVAANPAVRRNALQLLVDAFPLHDPETSQAMRSQCSCNFPLMLVTMHM
jgi:Condensin II non structural maintenance of chromosomes subunit